jgi:hypothetical protein
LNYCAVLCTFLIWYRFNFLCEGSFDGRPFYSLIIPDWNVFFSGMMKDL